MSHIYNCEQIKKRIEDHSHYGRCFNGEVYHQFCSGREKLSEFRKSYDKLIDKKERLISLNYEYKNKRTEYNNYQNTSNIKYNNTKKNYDEKEKLLALENENKIQELIKQNELKKIKADNNLNSLNEEIENLKVMIDNLKEQDNMDIDCKKKTILNKIKNDYKLKLVKYQNEKEKEKARAMALYEIKKKNFEVQKELEINKMKNISLIIQEIITIFKTNSLNN